MKLSLFLLVSSLNAFRYRRGGAGPWNYHHKQGADWVEMEGNQCSSTVRQSPIDIPAETAEEKVTSSWNRENYDKSVQWEASNNGHSVTLNLKDQTKLKVSGGHLPGPYQLAQFHFHWGDATNPGSEHLVAGHRHFAEIHLVHWKEEYASLGESVKNGDGLAVLGFFVDSHEGHEEGPLDKLIQTQIGMAVEKKGSTHNVTMAMQSIIPAELDNYYRYMGSLTTPGCNEVVVWTVFKEALMISPKTREMMISFADESADSEDPITLNYRLAQPLSGRTVTYYSSAVTEVAEPKKPKSAVHEEAPAPEPKESGHNWTMYIIGLVVVVAIAGAAIFCCRKKNDDYTAGNQ